MRQPLLLVDLGDTRAVVEPGEVAVLGRAEDCTIRLDDGRVSRRHVRARMTDEGWLLEDLASTGGTWVASDRVQQVLVTGPLDVRLGEPGTGQLVRFSLEPSVDERPGEAARLVDEASGPVVRPVGRSTTRARPPSGIFTVTHAPRERTRIGRASDNDIVIDDLLVSRYQAELHATSSGLELIDVGSRNGTFVNGRPVQRAVLEEFDLVSIGHGLFRLVGGRLEEYHDTGDVTFEAAGISTRRADGHTLLDDVSFSLSERSLLAVVGPSGSGKSTLLAALAGLKPADEGRALYGGRDLYEDYAELRSRIGFVPQDDVLHRELTVRSTLDYAGRLRFPADVTSAEAEKRIDDLLAELGIAHRDQAPLDQLSGGERKRTNVVSELLTGPSLLFLDEPTSGLDPGICRVLMQKLRELADDGRTVVVVTHELANLDLCDQLLVLAPGGVPAYFGPPDRAAARFGHDDLSGVFNDLSNDPGSHWRADQHPTTVAMPTLRGRANQVELSRIRRRGWWSQLATLISRNVAVLAADRRNAALLLLQAPVLGLLLLAALPAGELAAPAATEVRFVSVAGLVLFVLVLVGTWVGANNSIREIARELPILRRERAVGLSLSAYVTSKAIVLGGLTLVQSVVLVTLAIARQRGPVDAVLLGWARGELIVAVTFAALAAMALGLLVSASAGTPERATSLLPMVLVVQLLLSAGIMLPEIVDKPVLREAAVVSSAHWGVAAAASTTDINRLQIFDERLRELRSVDAADPGPAIAVLTKDAEPEQRWQHTRTAWITSILALLMLTVLPLIATAYVLRRYDPGR